MTKTDLGVNPWLKIWVKPKATIRKIINYNPNFRLFLISVIYGFVSLVSSSQRVSLGHAFHFFLILFLCVVIAPIWGYIVFSVFSFFVYFTGKWLKGRAKFREVRSAIAWSNVPMIANIFMWILLFIIFGSAIFKDFPASFVFMPLQRILLFLISIFQLIISIWIIVLYINTVSEVQKFSIGKAILNILIAIVIFISIFFVISLVYFLIMRGLQLR